MQIVSAQDMRDLVGCHTAYTLKYRHQWFHTLQGQQLPLSVSTWHVLVRQQQVESDVDPTCRALFRRLGGQRGRLPGYPLYIGTRSFTRSKANSCLCHLPRGTFLFVNTRWNPTWILLVAALLAPGWSAGKSCWLPLIYRHQKFYTLQGQQLPLSASTWHVVVRQHPVESDVDPTCRRSPGGRVVSGEVLLATLNYRHQ